MKAFNVLVIIVIVFALTFYGILLHQHDVETDKVIKNMTTWDTYYEGE